MAGKFIELKEAAQQLGITAERLLEMREAGDIHGYRDGASWKFKPEELERVATELAAEGSQISDSAPLSQDDLAGLLDVNPESDSDEGLDGSSILISEEPHAKDEGGSSSTVIGQEKSQADEDDGSDLKLVDSVEEAEPADVESDLQLADDEDMSDELELELDNDLEFDSDDALVLGDESALKLADSGEQVLGDSDLDSDSSVPAVGGGSSSSGLSGPSDSGLSLEASDDDLSGGALELPEDDEMISLDDEFVASADEATQLQQDEEFLLSPSGEMLGDEASDSGSQVIALEESDSFGDEAVVAADSGDAILEPEEAESLDSQLAFESVAAVEHGAIPLSGADLPEAPYSIWNILSLLLIVALLAVTGMLMTDVVRNMWAFGGESNLTSGVADALVSLLGMN